MNHIYLFLALCFCIPFSTIAQHKMVSIEDSEQKLIGTAYPSSIKVSELAGEALPGTNNIKWATQVRNIEGSKHYSPDSRPQGQKIYSPTPSSEPSSKTNADPVIVTNFEGNLSVNSTPPDNTIAISNGGYIVSANNDGIEVNNESGNRLYFDFWEDFVNDPALNSSLYDPKVIYDSQADRFVLILLRGLPIGYSK